MPRPPRRLLAALAILGALSATGCAATADEDAPADAASPLRIAAAASLSGVLDDVVESFRREHPDIAIDPVVYEGSGVLATQIEEGADYDIAAFADEATARRIADVLPHPEAFATNSLVIAVREDADGIRSLADLADPNLSVVLCAPEVPCGAAARTALDAAGVDLTPASVEQNVSAVLTKVQTGEADAGLVYRTDVRAGDGIRAIRDAHLDEVVNRYPIGVLDGAGADAQRFVDFVLSDEAQRLFADRGFGAP